MYSITEWTTTSHYIRVGEEQERKPYPLYLELTNFWYKMARRQPTAVGLYHTSYQVGTKEECSKFPMRDKLADR